MQTQTIPHVLAAVCIMFLSACATKSVRPPPAPNQPAKLGTALKMLGATTLDIGNDGIIHPHQAGALAQDPQGNIWVSRKMPGGDKNAFYPKATRSSPQAKRDQTTQTNQ